MALVTAFESLDPLPMEVFFFFQRIFFCHLKINYLGFLQLAGNYETQVRAEKISTDKQQIHTPGTSSTGVV